MVFFRSLRKLLFRRSLSLCILFRCRNFFYIFFFRLLFTVFRNFLCFILICMLLHFVLLCLFLCCSYRTCSSSELSCHTLRFCSCYLKNNLQSQIFLCYLVCFLCSQFCKLLAIFSGPFKTYIIVRYALWRYFSIVCA